MISTRICNPASQPNDGTAKIGSLHDSDYVCFEVQDDGCGMDAPTLQTVFELHYTTKSAGSGLGMASVRQIVDEHDGAVTVISQPEKGTRVRVLLPIAKQLRQSVVRRGENSLTS